MILKNKMKKISILLLFFMLFNIIPFEGIAVVWAQVDAGNGVIIDDITYVRVHSGKTITEGTLGIGGSGLSSATVLIKSKFDGGFDPIPSDMISSSDDNYIEFQLSAALTSDFDNEIRIGSKRLVLETDTFPTITDFSTNNVNIDNGETIVIDVDNIADLDGALPAVEAFYGKGENNIITDLQINGGTSQITLSGIPVTRPKGLQRIMFKGTKTIAVGLETFTLDTSYIYNNAFRLVGNLDAGEITMSPNTGSKGSLMTLSAPSFNSAKNYKAFFFKDLVGGDDYTGINGAETVSLTMDVDGTNDRLLVKIPSDPAFDLRSYNVVLAEVIGSGVSEEIISTQVVGPAPIPTTTPDSFTVIGGDYIATLDDVHPDKGSDRGADVQFIGNNLVSLNVPDLVVPTDIIETATLENSGKDLKIAYTKNVNAFTYNGVDVTVDRTLSAQIGLPVTFVQSGSVYYVKSTQDKVFVHTGIINDSEDDPTRDVIVTIETIIKEMAPSTKEYRIEQVINMQDGFEFEPYSLTPEIDKVVPELLQVVPQVPNYKLNDTVLISITGDKFLVDRYETGGEYKTSYPKVLLKVQETLVESEYDIKIDPNEEYTYVGTDYRGSVRAIQNDAGAPNDDLVLVDDDGSAVPAPVKMIVLDADGKVVDGSDGNSVGTRILVEIPKEALTEKKGFKNIHIVNPQRDNPASGKESIKIGILEFVETPNFPVIEEVSPRVVTVEGGEVITITGTNIEEGVKLYLDGEEITAFTRDIDATGLKLIVKFTAPPGREGTTQILLVNTSGGIAVSGFTYVSSFNKDPELISFAPTKGTVDTMVLVNGDNYLRPDPTVSDTAGVNAYRLIGTRVYLDGKDVNKYNFDAQKNIKFTQYDVPTAIHFLNTEIVDAIPDPDIKQMILTPFWENIEVQDESNNVWWIGKDIDNNPMITNRDDDFYVFKYNSAADTIEAYDKDNILIPAFDYVTDSLFVPDAGLDLAKAVEVLSDVGAHTFTLTMNNHHLTIKNDPENKPFISLADYSEDMVFTSNTITDDYFVLYKDYNGSIMLSNGNDRIYQIEYKDTLTTDIVAVKKSTGEIVEVTAINERGFIIFDGSNIVFQMYTPFEIKDHNYGIATKEIIGKRAKVVSKTQIKFLVPLLDSGKGLKDIAVVNPDTKSDIQTKAFDYISQTSTHPAISSISPDSGAVDGGYVITIYGKEFENTMKVYIDSVLVPAIDTNVAIDGKSVTVRVPKCIKNLAEEFKVDRLRVPVVVLNNDGGSAYDEDGFMYIIPTSAPEIDTIIPATGSTIGGTLVEIIGYEFRFFEPYTNKVGGPEYNPGDPFTDLNGNNIWDDLIELDKTDSVPKLNFPVPAPNPYFTDYYDSDIMPKIYLNEKEAKVVEFAKGYIKIITPVHTNGTKDLYVVNNDSGISNKEQFVYTSSNPTVTSIVPNHGRKLGFESRDIYGTTFASSKVKGYVRNVADTIVELTNIQMPVQFGNLSNRAIDRAQPNAGIINAGKSTVTLAGSLTATYELNGAGGNPEVEIIINESNKIYRKTFTNYDNGPVFIPVGMLQAGADYYMPNGFDMTEISALPDAEKIFEYIKVEVDDKRFLVDRGYAQKVIFDNDTHITVTTPSYYTIDPVPLSIYNPDGGKAVTTFTFNNPASTPKIYNIEPKALDATGLEYYVQATTKGGIELEIKGIDLREGAKVSIGNKVATVVDHTFSTEVVDGLTVDLDVLIVTVPVASTADIDKKVPILVENTDSAVANSSQLSDLYGTINTKPYYFVYRKPLSDPVIQTVVPEETSRAGGNTITFWGTDFRDGCTVIIGSKGGVPVKDVIVSERGKKLEFVSPATLTVGVKDVQVINTDFGTGTKPGGLKIVSDPITTIITKADGTTPLDWVSVEGGDQMTIKGTGFMTGAKVVIGGTRTLKADAKEAGEDGLYIHDEYITVAGGTLATGVEFVDDKTLVVTTPEILEEDLFIVTVINADGGISDSNLDIEYKEPVPSTPVGLEGELINNQYVKIFNYTSDNFDYFEIYYYIGTQSETGLVNNFYKDFTFVDTTEIEPYRMTDIPGVENLRENEKLWVVLRAFNQYGPSNWSNMINFSAEELKDVERIGETDSDGALEVPDWLDFETTQDATTITSHLKHKDLPSEIILDYTNDKYDGLLKRIITLPSEIVKESLTLVIANYGDSKLQFMPINLNTEAFREMNFYEKSYGKITNEVLNNELASFMKGQIPRGYKSITPLIRISFESKNNNESASIDKLNGTMDLSLYYGNIKLTQTEVNTLKIYKFDTDKNIWVSASGTINKANQTVYTRINEPGSYILMIRRY